MDFIIQSNTLKSTLVVDFYLKKPFDKGFGLGYDVFTKPEKLLTLANHKRNMWFFCTHQI